MRKPRFLLDANISPETAIFMRSLGYEAKSLIEEDLGGLDDETVAKIVRKEKRVLITFDLDFGEMYYFSSKQKFSVVVLRLADQRVENVNYILEKFLTSRQGIFKNKILAVLSEAGVRIAR